MKELTSQEQIERLRQLEKSPIVWTCTKKHTHTTRACSYSLKQPTWADIGFLLGELERRALLLQAEEVYDY